MTCQHRWVFADTNEHVVAVCEYCGAIKKAEPPKEYIEDWKDRLKQAKRTARGEYE